MVLALSKQDQFSVHDSENEKRSNLREHTTTCTGSRTLVTNDVKSLLFRNLSNGVCTCVMYVITFIWNAAIVYIPNDSKASTAVIS